MEPKKEGYILTDDECDEAFGHKYITKRAGKGKESVCKYCGKAENTMKEAK